MKCKYCSSQDTIRFGKRKNRKRTVQLFKCGGCNKRFSDTNSLLYTREPEKIISKALYLYFDGLSLRKISRYLKNFHSIDVSHSTIHSWVIEYTERINRYLDPIIADANSVWHVDEMMINIKGRLFWLWNVIDEDTKFFISTRLTEERTTNEAEEILQRARSKTQGDPEVLISDGLAVYKSAFKTIWKEKDKPTYHVWGVREKDAFYNTFVERLNGSIRERVKVTRAYKELYSAKTILNGWQTYYNFVRPHQSLKGKTPAEAAGINLDLGKDKWLGLIKLSIK